jgi:hypothetical protein
MSCNTLCPCISSVWEQYSKILHNKVGWKNTNLVENLKEINWWFDTLRQNVKIIFCCYHVQISLSMSQKTQSDIFHTKMLQNAPFYCKNTFNNIFPIIIVIKKKKMSCNTWCPCISSVWEQYSKILHNMHFLNMPWYFDRT